MNKYTRRIQIQLHSEKKCWINEKGNIVCTNVCRGEEHCGTPFISRLNGQDARSSPPLATKKDPDHQVRIFFVYQENEPSTPRWRGRTRSAPFRCSDLGFAPTEAKRRSSPPSYYVELDSGKPITRPSGVYFCCFMWKKPNSFDWMKRATLTLRKRGEKHIILSLTHSRNKRVLRSCIYKASQHFYDVDGV